MAAYEEIKRFYFEEQMKNKKDKRPVQQAI
jgi:hypothetical protein